MIQTTIQKQIHLPYGKTNLQVTLSDQTPVDILTLPADTDNDEHAIITSALQSPIGTPPLRELAGQHRKAVILISDITRLSPSHTFLPYIIDELISGGIKEENITIVVALGLHRHMTDDEIKELVGEQIKERIRCINHSALQEDCVSVGHTSRGTPAAILREVVEADLRIATGNIELHKMAGFSGGVKALMPGVASEQTIKHNHALSKDVHAAPARIDDNPVRLDMEEVAQMVPIHFLFNVLVNPQRRILQAFAGDPVQAHRQGVEQAKKLFHHQLPSLYDMVICSAGGEPKDLNLYQGIKSLYNAKQAVRQGGIIVFCASCKEGYGNGEFQRWMEVIADPRKIAKKFAEQFVLGGHKAADAVEYTTYAQVYMVSDLAESIQKLLGTVPYASAQEAVDAALAQLTDPKILVMPYGSLTFVQTPVKV